MQPPEPTAGTEKPGRIFLALSAAALAVGVWRAWSLWFVNDDAFISFRYARHLAEGLGLVYNPGERVEGFTNFLWTLLVAGAMRLGADPVIFSVAVGILCFVATLALWAYVSWRLRAPGAIVLIPLTSLALACHRDMQVYATSGLETSLFTFLVSALFALLALGRTPWALLLAGVSAVLAMMTRPDAVIFLASAVVFVAATRRERLRRLAIFLLPVLLLFVPYWFWRAGYYGYFFPNAFYAKSINLPYYAQGLEYARLYFSTYYVLGLIPLLAVVILVARRNATPAAGTEAFWQPAMILAVLFAAAATVFNIRIGGDFMFARFFVPVTPMLYLIVELLIQRLPLRTLSVTATVAVIAMTLLRNDQFRDASKIGYIADEWQWYPANELRKTQQNGALLRTYFSGLPVRVAYWAGQAKLMYYADPYVAIEASAGLTDAVIAHREIGERGRPGHEKSAPPEYLVERGVHFLFGPLAPPPGPMPANLIVFDSIAAKIITYDDSIMSHMALRPGVQFIQFPEFLDRYIAGLGTQPREQVESDLRFFRTFYFNHNADAGREQAILTYLGRDADEQP